MPAYKKAEKLTAFPHSFPSIQSIGKYGNFAIDIEGNTLDVSRDYCSYYLSNY
jgi:hypothetical protein